MATFRDYLNAVKGEIDEVGVDDVHALVSNGSAATLIDVRETTETADGHIDTARLIPRGVLELRIESIVPDKETELVLYCAGGTRSALAAKSLQILGYANVSSMSGGFQAWKQRGYHFVVPRVLTPSQQSRYSRHLLIPEVGEAGQQKLLDSKVLLMGAGGLGSPAALYLAAAGVGRLGIIDSDVVDRSNLQRQVIHTDERVGVPKVDSARETLAALNPDVDIVTYNMRLTSENVMEVFEGYDLVVDGGDNFPTRYLVNDACVHLGIPNVHGSVYRFEGQVTVFVPGQGPCYRCLYPEPPPPELAPSCQEAGVLGVLPGIIGLLQATEAVKLCIGAGTSLAGRLLCFDALDMKFRELKLRRDPQCAMCGDHAEFTGFIDYEQFCSFSPAA
jgi:molybdopterin/thiamine biosynthesis adenylyltransferase/rhodanese-related sulfurtransferase